MRSTLPDPAPGTVRRTLSLEVAAPDQDWSAGLRVSAWARDLLAGAGPEDSRVLRAVRLTVTIDAASRVTGIEGPLAPAVTAPLIGAPATRGFRARLAGLTGLDPSSLESAVLDELPTVRLIAGYAQLIEQPARPLQPAGPSEPARERDRDRDRSSVVDICVGWAAGATADRRARAGVPVVTGTPAAPAITAMTPYFHAEPAPRARTMRRRRILDVFREADGAEIFAYFRDSHIDAQLREGALHEYEVHARTAADDQCTLERIAVVPHALPFSECPLAAPNAADLTGAPLRSVTGTVRERLTGTRSCTHLNDTLRFLRYVPVLLEPPQNARDR